MKILNFAITAVVFLSTSKIFAQAKNPVNLMVGINQMMRVQGFSYDSTGKAFASSKDWNKENVGNTTIYSSLEYRTKIRESGNLQSGAANLTYLDTVGDSSSLASWDMTLLDGNAVSLTSCTEYCVTVDQAKCKSALQQLGFKDFQEMSSQVNQCRKFSRYWNLIDATSKNAYEDSAIERMKALNVRRKKFQVPKEKIDEANMSFVWETFTNICASIPFQEIRKATVVGPKASGTQ